ncbi:unnamed protein product [Ilex paraguariensis]|uniref:Uncharacterized protein n=1 Tax=Ilex paraguariensis TaxID=185542 RepID=A0ABC8R4I7_9AQUA
MAEPYSNFFTRCFNFIPLNSRYSSSTSYSIFPSISPHTDDSYSYNIMSVQETPINSDNIGVILGSVSSHTYSDNICPVHETLGIVRSEESKMFSNTYQVQASPPSPPLREALPLLNNLSFSAEENRPSSSPMEDDRKRAKDESILSPVDDEGVAIDLHIGLPSPSSYLFSSSEEIVSKDNVGVLLGLPLNRSNNVQYWVPTPSQILTGQHSSHVLFAARRLTDTTICSC